MAQASLSRQPDLKAYSSLLAVLSDMNAQLVVAGGGKDEISAGERDLRRVAGSK